MFVGTTTIFLFITSSYFVMLSKIMSYRLFPFFSLTLPAVISLLFFFLHFFPIRSLFALTAPLHNPFPYPNFYVDVNCNPFLCIGLLGDLPAAPQRTVGEPA
jgi:hypothetical protein